MDRSGNTINRTDPLATTSAILLPDNVNHLLLYTIHSNRPRNLTLLIPAKSAKKSSKKALLYNILVAAEFTTKTKDELLIMDCHNGLWSAQLDDIRSAGGREAHPTIDLYIVAKYLGPLLGSSTALTVSQSTDAAANKDTYLYYHLPRDGAVLRWNFHQPLTAEGHEVLHFARKPIVQILFGAKGSVWIVHEQNDQFGDHCRRIFPPGPFNERLFL